MKKYLLAMLLLCVAASAFAQKKDADDEVKGFRADRLFLGGSIALGFGDGSFAAGGNPEIGYTFAQWLDAGIAFNAIYNSITAESNLGIRVRSWNYGGGMFVRLYPINELFVQILPEYNWISTKYKDVINGEEAHITTAAPSLLLGAGYCSRNVGGSSFYTVIMFDAGTNTNSPYIGSLGSKFPILRTGFNFYLGRGQKRK